MAVYKTNAQKQLMKVAGNKSGSSTVKKLYNGGATQTAGTITLEESISNYKELQFIQHYSPSTPIYSCHTVPVELFKLMYSTNEFLCASFGSERWCTYKYIDDTHIQFTYSYNSTYFFTVYGVK